jgi:hypothetical protein
LRKEISCVVEKPCGEVSSHRTAAECRLRL